MMKPIRGGEDLSILQMSKQLDKPKMFDKKLVYPKETGSSVFKKINNVLTSPKVEERGGISNVNSPTFENSENSKMIGLSTRFTHPNQSNANNLQNNASKCGKEELIEILSATNATNGIKNISGLMAKTEPNRIPPDSQEQQLSQRTIEGIIKSQKSTYMIPYSSKSHSIQTSTVANLGNKPKTDQKTSAGSPQPNFLADTSHYNPEILPSSELAKTLQRLKQSGSSQQLQSSSVFNSSGSQQYKSFFRAQTNNFFNDETKSSQQQQNQIAQFSSSTGFQSSTLKATAKKSVSQTQQQKLMSTKRLFETSKNNNREEPQQNNEKQKSTSLQRFSGQLKQNLQSQSSSPFQGQTAITEYFSKLISKAKKEPSVPEFQSQNQSADQTIDVLSNQQNNKSDKNLHEKEVQETFFDTISQIKREISKQQPQDPQKLVKPQSQIQCASPSTMLAKQTYDPQKTLPNSRPSPQSQSYFQKTDTKMSESYSTIKQGENSPATGQAFLKKSESFRIPTNDQYGKKSNSLNKREATQNQFNSSQKTLVKPNSATKKSTESPSQKNRFPLKVAKNNNISNLFKGNILRNSLQASSFQQKSSTSNPASKIAEQNQKSLTMSAAIYSSLRKSESSSQSTNQPTMNSSLNRFTLPQSVEYLLRPPNGLDSFDTKKQPSSNRQSDIISESTPLHLSDLDTPFQHHQEVIIARKNRIETPINVGFCYYNTSMDMHNRYPNDNDYNCGVFRHHFEQSFNILKHLKQINPVDPLLIESKVIDLPPNPPNRKTIIFDLDETLIHSFPEPTHCDVIIPFTAPDGEQDNAYVNIRPFARECLRELSKHFEIMIFTASQSCYAEKIIDYLDPKRQYVDYRLSKESCLILEDELHVKDLRILKNRDLKNVVIVDNAVYSFAFQVDNGIPIIPFFDNKKDMELKYLVDFLKQLIDKEDVRPYLHKVFKFYLYSECQTREDALERIYAIKTSDLGLADPSFTEQNYDDYDTVMSGYEGSNFSPELQQSTNFRELTQENNQPAHEDDSGFDIERDDFSEVCDQQQDIS